MASQTTQPPYFLPYMSPASQPSISVADGGYIARNSIVDIQTPSRNDTFPPTIYNSAIKGRSLYYNGDQGVFYKS
jgi:hypothetical protein